MAWSVLFAWLALLRHEAGGTHAEDLGFTDQVIWNFLRGQWFRMSVYQGAAWNTELDLAGIARPDSLLAFHVEPMLLLFVPLYALGADSRVLLLVQAFGLGLGALPAYALGARWGGRWVAGAAVAAAYLLSPLGQWVALADFHTTALAAPLLLLSIERLSAGRPRQAFLACLLALTAREDVALAAAGLGLSVLLGGLRSRSMSQARWGTSLCVLAVLWAIGCLLVIRHYGGGVSPFAERYGLALGGIWNVLLLLARLETLEYLLTLLLSGGWLGFLAPVAALPAMAVMASNVLSISPWMASGKAHYSALLLPFIAMCAAAGLRALDRGPVPRPAAAVARPSPFPIRLSPLASRLTPAVLVLTSGLAYFIAGAGPGAANYAPADAGPHARLAETIARDIPARAVVSASTSLVPRLSHREGLYVFPAVEDADFVFVDLSATPAPTSAGDVFLRMRTLLSQGGWSVDLARDGLLLLSGAPGAPPITVDDLPNELYSFARADQGLFAARESVPASDAPLATFLDGRLELLSARFVIPPEGVLAPRFARAALRTTWRALDPLPPGVRPEFLLEYQDSTTRRPWDLPVLWWYPPHRWAAGEPIQVDLPDVPLRGLRAWTVGVISPSSAPR